MKAKEFYDNHKPEVYFTIGLLTGIAMVMIIQGIQLASINCGDACSACTLCKALIP